MRNLLAQAAEELGAEACGFTERQLYHAVRRLRGTTLREGTFHRALRGLLSREPLRGLLPERPSRGPSAIGQEAVTCLPEAVLFVDRRAILDVFVACGVAASGEYAVVSPLDGYPSCVITLLSNAFREGHRIPVVYLHDAATVVYPFVVEPLASLVEQQDPRPLPYADIGLPPLGASPRRFGDARLPPDELILELEALPPRTLVRYATEAADRLALQHGLTRRSAPRRGA